MSHRVFIGRTLRQIGLLALGLAMLSAPTCRCLAQEHAKTDEELQRQRAKMAKLQQVLDQQQVNMESMQQEMRQQMQQREREMRRERAEVEAQLQEAWRQYHESQAAAAASAGRDRQVVVFDLKHSAADEAADAISRVLGPGTLRVAVDERANRLIVSSSEKQIAIIRSLLQRLDVERSGSTNLAAAEAASEMLQVRVIWLSDYRTGKSADITAAKLDSRVLESLHPLGFDSTKIVCQTVTSVVVTNRQENGFSFSAPVTLGESVVLFAGTGKIEASADGRYLVKVRLSVNSGSSGGGGPGDLANMRRGCQVQGAISTPLENYTILGTGVVVTAPGTPPKPKQVPCAFVLQLKHAEGFPPHSNGSAAAR